MPERSGALDYYGYFGFTRDPWNPLEQIDEKDSRFVGVRSFSTGYAALAGKLKTIGDKGTIIVVVGDRGAGKTTFLRSSRNRLPADVHGSIPLYVDFTPVVATIQENPVMSRRVLVDSVIAGLAQALGLPADRPPAVEVVLSAIKEPGRAGTKVVLLIDNLDKLYKEAELHRVAEILSDQQGFFERIVQYPISFVFSASPKWEFLSGEDFRIFNFRNRIDLHHADRADVIKVLEARISFAGATMAHVFEGGAIGPLQALSSGVTGRLLEFAELVTQQAWKEGVRPVTREFIDNRFGDQIQRTYDDFVRSRVRLSNLKDGYQRIFTYYQDCRVADHSLVGAFQLLESVFQSESIHGRRGGEGRDPTKVASVAPEASRLFLRNVGKLSLAEGDEFSGIEILRIRGTVLDFLVEWASRFGIDRLLDYLAVGPILPAAAMRCSLHGDRPMALLQAGQARCGQEDAGRFCREEVAFTSRRIVLDTCALVDRVFTRTRDGGLFRGMNLILPKAVRQEIQNWEKRTEKKAEAHQANTEIMELAGARGILLDSFGVTGQELPESEIGRPAVVDSQVLRDAFSASAVLLTADATLRTAAITEGVPILYYHKADVEAPVVTVGRILSGPVAELGSQGDPIVRVHSSPIVVRNSPYRPAVGEEIQFRVVEVGERTSFAEYVSPSRPPERNR